jgi:hypothetical protein
MVDEYIRAILLFEEPMPLALVFRLRLPVSDFFFPTSASLAAA